MYFIWEDLYKDFIRYLITESFEIEFCRVYKLKNI